MVPVGVDPDGLMEIPGATEVGWYEPGVRPGSGQGSAVLAAHVDYAGRAGAFFDLRSLPEGAEILVVGPDGHELRFVVDGRTQVDKDALAVEELFRSAGSPDADPDHLWRIVRPVSEPLRGRRRRPRRSRGLNQSAESGVQCKLILLRALRR